jgi:alkylation response protein AidB-like acyl-CoA dehydrogenase
MSLAPLALGADLDRLRSSARDFAQGEILPRVAEAEATETFPRDLFEIAGSAGFIGAHYPVAVGGRGAALRSAMIVREEFSYRSVGISSGLGHQDHVGTAYLHRFGTADQQAEWLRPALAGRVVIAMAITEPDAGSDVRRMRTSARRTDAGWVISGRKTFITNGPLADAIVVTARLEDSDRFGVFIVRRSDVGFVCERTFAKLGCRSSEVGELVFNDVHVADDRRLSPPAGSPLGDILDVLIVGRLLVAASALGLARRALDLGLDRAVSRRTFGEPIGRRQEISMKFAQATTQLRAAELLAYHAASVYAQSGTVPVLECSQAKLLAAEVACDVTDQMMRVFGGAGFLAESEIERLYRDARFFTIVEGTAEIQHRIIAAQLGI